MKTSAELLNEELDGQVIVHICENLTALNEAHHNLARIVVHLQTQIHEIQAELKEEKERKRQRAYDAA